MSNENVHFLVVSLLLATVGILYQCRRDGYLYKPQEHDVFVEYISEYYAFLENGFHLQTAEEPARAYGNFAGSWKDSRRVSYLMASLTLDIIYDTRKLKTVATKTCLSEHMLKKIARIDVGGARISREAAAKAMPLALVLAQLPVPAEVESAVFEGTALFRRARNPIELSQYGAEEGDVVRGVNLGYRQPYGNQ